jgi:D-alanyl-D-alanine carboxypeptidase
MRSALPRIAVAVFATLAANAACAASPPRPSTEEVAASPTPPPAGPASAAPAGLSSPTSPSATAPAGSAAPEGSAAPPAVATPAPSATASPALATSASTVSPAEGTASACNEQAPQDFLVRGNFLKEKSGNERAIQYRTDQYGYFPGFGRAPPGAKPPSAEVVTTKFMGLSVRMHQKVVPALACVEKEIQVSCADHPYTPHALAGIRFRNTYRGGEVTNHAYGIAIDVDPDINTCCGCVPPWNDAPACKRKGKSEYDHMAMPECWVHAFERFGFYWLGHDVLRDTMHFEFLGDPDKIVKQGTSGASPEPAR